ncbi:MAG: hypothetical protein ACYC6N_08745 [Pirellulaceae bacterium]
MNEEWQARNIQDHMAQIRRDVDQAVGDIADQVQDLKEQLADWRYYVRRYPWIVAAGAAAAGYLIVPTRAPRTVHPDPESLAALSREGRLTIRQKPTTFQALTKVGLDHLSSVMIRSAASYVADKLKTASATSPRSEAREW